MKGTDDIKEEKEEKDFKKGKALKYENGGKR